MIVTGRRYQGMQQGTKLPGLDIGEDEHKLSWRVKMARAAAIRKQRQGLGMKAPAPPVQLIEDDDGMLMLT